MGINNASNVAISGVGGAGANWLDGQGAGWWEGKSNGTLRVTPGHLVETMWSTDIEISGVTLLDSPFWNTHLWSSQRIWVHDVAVQAPPKSPNTDGFASTGPILSRQAPPSLTPCEHNPPLRRIPTARPTC